MVRKYRTCFEARKRYLKERGTKVTCQTRESHFHALIWLNFTVDGHQLRSRLDLGREVYPTDMRRGNEVWLPYLRSLPRGVARPFKWRASRAAAEQALAELAGIPRDLLSPNDRVAYDTFRWTMQESHEHHSPGAAAIWTTMVVNQSSGWHLGFTNLSSGEDVAPYRTVQDYEHGLSRIMRTASDRCCETAEWVRSSSTARSPTVRSWK